MLLVRALLKWPHSSALLWTAAPRVNPRTCASRDDFVLGRPQHVSIDYGLDRAIPYTWQRRTKSILYTLHDSPADVLKSVFLYRTQHEQARAMLEVRYVDVLRRERIESEPAPLFLISPGRAGSTLLGRLTRAAGKTSLLEPDLYTVLGRKPARPEVTRALIRNATASLGRLAGTNTPVIKLRSEAAPLWRALAQALPQARFGVLLRRDVTAWARSTHRAFGVTPRGLVQTLNHAIAAYHGLEALGRAPVLLDYEGLTSRPIQALTALGLSVPPSRGLTVKAVLAGDSQAGTPLARTQLTPRPSEASAVSEFGRRWSRSGCELPEPHAATREDPLPLRRAVG